MPDADPFPKVKREILRVLTDSVRPLGFIQFRKTTFFIRDRGPIRDIFFVQKMRSNAISIAYGVLIVPDNQDWSPGIPNARWLRNQEFYRCKYVDHVVKSIGRAADDFLAEAVPWFAEFQTLDDVTRLQQS